MLPLLHAMLLLAGQESASPADLAPSASPSPSTPPVPRIAGSVEDPASPDTLAPSPSAFDSGHSAAVSPLAMRGTRPGPASRAESHQGGHFRLGLQANDGGIGLQAGASGRAGHLAWGLDLWARPGAWPRQVRTSPTRRARFQEFLYGVATWAQWELAVGRPAVDLPPWRLAGVAGLELTDGKWYGTGKAPDADIAPSAGLRILAPQVFQIGLRYAFGNERLIGAWRGDVACEF